MFINKKAPAILALACSSLAVATAQSTQLLNDEQAEYKLAKTYVQQNEYSLAYPIFKKLNKLALYPQANTKLLSDIEKTECEFYSHYCGLVLDDPKALDAAIDFTLLNHSTAHIQMLQYQIAEYYYRDNNFNEALSWYNKLSIHNLTNIEISNLKFHKAYILFTQQNFKEAKNLFNAVRQINGDANFIDANYYYGFIAFHDKQYNEAQKAFLLVEKDAKYSSTVPFYLSEIYYFNKETDKALAYAENALDLNNQYYESELKQLIGHIYFGKKEYRRALPFLEYYVQHNEKVRREDLYQLSYCYYAAKSYLKSIDGFKQLGGKEDSLAQNSMYLLADAYLKTNQKANARNAFLFCASNSSHAMQKQVSVFNYGKLSYELGYLNEALQYLQLFLNTYPTSAYVNEAKEHLVNTLAATSNYKQALEIYESLPQKTENITKVYPKLLYNRAVELVNEKNFEKAQTIINKVLAMDNYSGIEKTLALFWIGEISYQQNQYDEAITNFNAYLKRPLTNSEVNINNAQYSLAYCLMKKGNFNAAAQQFEELSKYVNSNNPSSLEQDAYIRLADCNYMLKNFTTALNIYNNVISKNWATADYAFLQKAVIAGAQNKQAEKIQLLQQFNTYYANNPMLADANMELANTYINSNTYAKAVEPLKKIIEQPKFINYHPQAYLKLGIAHFNLREYPAALENFSVLNNRFPNTPESNESIDYVKNIFVENQQPQDFLNFMQQNGKTVTYNEADSITYQAAYLAYENKDAETALKSFTDYLNKYPDGKNYLEANYYIAETYVQQKNNIPALVYYETLVNNAPNKFAERAAIQAARIYYFDKKDIALAEKYFTISNNISTQQDNKLESMRGLLRCQYKLQKWNDAFSNAEALLQQKNIAADDKMMANLIIAKNYQSQQKYTEALAAYKTLTNNVNTEYNAEAAYRVAEILLAQNKLPEAEKSAFECIKKFGSYDVWVTKSYIALGDIYFAQKDYFNAEATFKSVAENAAIAELKTEANNKLQKVIAEKNNNNQISNN